MFELYNKTVFIFFYVSYKRRYCDAKSEYGNFRIKKHRRRRRRKRGSGDSVRRRDSGDGVFLK